MKNLERQLLHSQKMEAVGTLAGGVAHDFNNILTGILGNLGLAMDRLPPDSDLRRYLETAGLAAERARDLTRHLLTFSRVTEPTKKPMSLAGPIQETVRLLAQALDRRIQIQAKVAKDLARIEADEGQMSQVLMNLCVNAGDAVEKRLAESPRPSGPASEHPAIVVRAANVDLPDIPDPIQNQRRPGRYVRLDVEDQGCGMDETTRSRIFEPFFTTKPIDKGTGLGLSTVYGIVRQHLGWIEVESEPDRGTRFSVYLPVTLNAPAETGDQGERFGALPGGTETILLVDDEDMIRDVGQELLESLGYQVLVAGDGQEALDRFRTDGGRLDLIILDMIMPRLSGLEVLKKVKSTRSRVKIILSSGNLLDSMAGTIPKEAAPEAFVAKPYRIQDLARIVRRVLDGQGEEERVSVKGESR
jgi:nitrogen-specific signal transduction histidine kinase/ActR/RegA family two-component response regulator